MWVANYDSLRGTTNNNLLAYDSLLQNELLAYFFNIIFLRKPYHDFGKPNSVSYINCWLNDYN